MPNGDFPQLELPLVNNSAISVGFASVEALLPLRNMLVQLFDKEDKDLKKIETSIQESDKNENKRHKESLKNDNTLSEKYIKNYNVGTDKVLKGLKENKDAFEKAQSYIVKGLKDAWNIFNSQLDSALGDMKVYTDLEHSGVLLKDGFDSLAKSAYELGITHEELAQRLSKMSPIIAKLNGSMGNGVKIFENSTKDLMKDYQMSMDDVQSVFESFIDSKTPIQLMSMSQEQLRIEVDKQAKSMKALSLATGKSIELIKQENDWKNRSLRVQAWKSTHEDAAKALQQAGMGTDEWIDYFASGGSRISTNVLMDMAGSQFVSALAKNNMNGIFNGSLNADSLADFIKKNQSLMLKDQQKIDVNSRNTSSMAAMAASDTYQHISVGALPYLKAASDLLSFNNNNMTSEQEAQRKKDKERINKVTDLFQAQNRASTSLYQLSGGIDKNVKVIETATVAVKSFSTAMNAATKALESVGLNNGYTGMIGGFLANAFGSYIGAKTFKGAGKAIKGVGNILKVGKASKFATTATKIGTKASTTLLKKIPGISLLTGTALAAQRAMNGEWLKAGGELLSGVLGSIPGLGTAASLAIDAALLASDLKGTTPNMKGNIDTNIKIPKMSGLKKASLLGVGTLAAGAGGYMAYNYFNKPSETEIINNENKQNTFSNERKEFYNEVIDEIKKLKESIVSVQKEISDYRISQMLIGKHNNQTMVNTTN